MSLISDALKEAQRERSERGSIADRATPSAAKTLFSSAKRSKKQWVIPVWAVVIAVVLVALTPLTVVLVRARMLRGKTTNAAPIAATTRTTSPATTAKTTAPIVAIAHDSTRFAPTLASRTATTPPQSATPSKPSSAPPRIEPRVESRAPVSSPPAPVRHAESATTKPNAGVAAQLAPATVAPIQSSGVRVILDPTNLRPSDSLFAQAYAEQTRGNGDRAAELYERALQLKPVSPQLYNDYGALLASRGNHTAALAMYNIGLKSDDKDPHLWSNLGDSYKAIGRHADAMSAFAEAAKLDPLNATLKTRLAAEYAAIGDSASARRGYEDAVRLTPRDAAVHYAFGTFLQSQRDYRGAVREFQLFADLAPGKFSPETIEAMRAHVARLAKLTP